MSDVLWHYRAMYYGMRGGDERFKGILNLRTSNPRLAIVAAFGISMHADRAELFDAVEKADSLIRTNPSITPEELYEMEDEGLVFPWSDWGHIKLIGDMFSSATFEYEEGLVAVSLSREGCMEAWETLEGFQESLQPKTAIRHILEGRSQPKR